MKYKNKIKKIDVLRWIAVLPITILILLIYIIFAIDIAYKFFGIFFDEELVAHIVGLINMLLMPILITASSYFLSPKYKFKSTLVFVLFFLLLESISVGLRIYEHMRLNPYIPLAAMIHLIALYVVYKVENKKK
jgi:hypothetical protein